MFRLLSSLVYLFSAHAATQSPIFGGFPGISSTPLNPSVVVKVGLESLQLAVIEGESVDVCAVIDMSAKLFLPLNIFPLILTITLEFITADASDLSPTIPTVLMVAPTNRLQCVRIATLLNDDYSATTEEMFAVLISSTALTVVVTRPRTVVTIHPAPISLSVPALVNVSEGSIAEICITANFPSNSSQELLMILLLIEDVSTSLDDFRHEAIPESLLLSGNASIQCLYIPTYSNDDGALTSSETFHILVGPGNLTVVVTLLEQCSPGDIRLVNGSDPTQGRLEICSHGEFGSVCNSIWTVQNAKVVCNQLGYYSDIDAMSEVVTDFGEGLGPIVLSEVNCTGNETDLLSCPASNNASNCSHRMDAGVDCFNNYTVEQIDNPGCVRGDVLPLVGGLSSREGLVEVCLEVGYFPLDLKTFTVHEANVLCRQMELGSAGFPLSAADDLGLNLVSYFDIVGSRVGRIDCTGNEDSIAECMTSWVTQTPEGFAAVRCTEAANCSDGTIRLAPAPSSLPSEFPVREGRVEICLQGVWGAIFDTNWSALDAAVTCRQLGLDSKGALPVVPALYPGDIPALPIIYDSPACDSVAHDSLLACPRVPILCLDEESPTASGRTSTICDGNLGCDPVGGSDVNGELAGVLGRLTRGGQVGTRALHGVVGVRCEDYAQVACRDFDVRLTYRERSMAAGNLEICSGNQWNIVCAHSFDQEDLNVACRVLGFTAYEQSIAEHHFIPTSVFASGATFDQGLNCSGLEKQLSECSIEQHPVQLESGITSFCSDARIECSATPRLFFDPLVRSDGVFLVEVNRRASLACLVDGASYPPVTSMTITPNPWGSGKVLNNSRSPFCLSAKIYATKNASTTDSRQYSCIVTSGGLTTSQTVNLTVKGPDHVPIRTPDYLRLSTFTSLLPLQQLVFDSISTNFPGQQKVQCQLTHRRPIDMETGMDRYECTIFYFGPSSSSLNFSVVEAATAVLQRFILFINTSGSGFCNYSETEHGGLAYTWPESIGGETVSQPCPASMNALTRLCSTAGAGWLAVNTSACEIVLNTIKKVLNDTISIEEYGKQVQLIANVLQESVADTTQQTSVVLDVLATFFDAVADVTTTGTRTTNHSIPTQVIEGLVNTLSSIQQWSADVLASSDSTSRIVLSFETTAARFSQQLEEDAETVTIPNRILFAAENTPVDSLQLTGRTYGVANNTLTSSEASLSAQTTDQNASISLPSNLFESVDDLSVGIFFALYTSPALFPLRSANAGGVDTNLTTPGRQGLVASPVLSTTVGSGLSFSNITPPVEIMLRLIALSGKVHVPGSETCVFWDFAAAEDKGNWSADGCTRVSVAADVVTCQCTHLTNFAILVDICTRVDGNCMSSAVLDRVLSFVTYIGVALSMFGLFASVITLLAFKKLRHRDASKFHIQLCISILCMLLVFVAGVEETEEYGGCVAVSLLLHYFTLAAVTWMTAEAALMFRKLAFVFKTSTHNYIFITSVICWSAPLVPVLIPVAIDLAQGNDPSRDLVTKRNSYCFLSNPIVFWVSFMGPVFAMLLINSVLFVVVVVILIRHTRNTMARRQEAMSNKTALRLMASIVSILFLFGLSWSFAALTFTVQQHIRLTAQILFAVFNSLQGFFLFIFFCVLNVEARESWKELLSCGHYTSKVLHPSKFRSGSFEVGGHHRVHSTITGSSTLGTGTGRVIQGFESFKMSHHNSTLSGPLRLQRSQKYAGTTINTTSQLDLSKHRPTDPKEKVSDDDNEDTMQSGREERRGKPMKARVKRYSTMNQHVEEYQVDFFDSSSDDEQKETTL